MTFSGKISFDDVLSRGKKVTDSLFLVSYLRKDQGPGRVGTSVPKRLVGRATERNKIKRVAREAFIGSLRRLPVDVIAVYKDRPAQKRSVKIVRESIQKHFDKIKTDTLPTDYIKFEQETTRYDLKSKFGDNPDVDVMVNISSEITQDDFNVLTTLRLAVQQYSPGTYKIGNLTIEILKDL